MRLLQILVVGAGIVFFLVVAGKDDRSGAPLNTPSVSQAAKAGGAVQLIGKIRSNAIQESSGIIASRTQTNVFWTHNDKGNRASVFAITREGALLGEFRIDAKNQDWEDIAADSEGHLYIGSIGNNAGLRATLEVLRISEPKLSAPQKKKSDRIPVERTWHLKYPGRRFDCESLFILARHGYVISKVQRREAAMIYRFPLDKGDDVLLEPVVSLPVYAPVTAADLSADGNWLAVMSGAGLYLFEIRGDVSRAEKGQPQFVSLPKLQFEAVCFTGGGLLMTAESGEIFSYSQAPEIR
jgi:hypothetical protein